MVSMRAEMNADKVHAVLKALGREARGPGRVYLTGGTTAVLEGWRQATIDADLKLDPEPAGIFAAIRRVKDELDVNVELASPDDFIPPLPGWRDRSRFIAQHGPVQFFHYDLYAQALAKVERGHDRDLADVREMLQRGLVEAGELRRLFAEIEPDLLRYPAVDPDTFRRTLGELLASTEDGKAAAPAGGRDE
ncbi:MAG: hypothetical protein AMXMBFR64_12640 [Myxococcales bacterium]